MGNNVCVCLSISLVALVLGSKLYQLSPERFGDWSVVTKQGQSQNWSLGVSIRKFRAFPKLGMLQVLCDMTAKWSRASQGGAWELQQRPGKDQEWHPQLHPSR